MSPRSTILSNQIRRQICKRAARLGSERDVPQAIFQTLLDAEVDPASVSLDQYKLVLIEALRSARQQPLRGMTAC